MCKWLFTKHSFFPHVYRYLLFFMLLIGVADALLDHLFGFVAVGKPDGKQNSASKGPAPKRSKPATSAAAPAAASAAAAAAAATNAPSSSSSSAPVISLTDVQKHSIETTIKKIKKQLPSNLHVPDNFIEERSKCNAATIQPFFSIYSLHCFHNILPKHLYELWSLFVSAFNTFVAYELTELQLCQAEENYNEFLHLLATGLPNFHFTVNVHLVEHIGDVIRDFGPSNNFWW